MPQLTVKILTLFPELFPGPLDCSIIGRALANKIWQLEVINIRDFARDKHKTVDDPPIGGGGGMVMRPDVLGNAIEHALADGYDYKIIYMSPRGRRLTQVISKELSTISNLIIICGRFEAIDQRLIEYYDMDEISLGDFVMTGGEIAAYALLDSVVRILPGVLEQEVFAEESFGDDPVYQNLLEYPQYTKPLQWNNLVVPEVLLSGNHQKIAQWKLEKAEKYTKDNRPDLWEKYNKQKD